jgi:hypothetical protein
MQAAQFTVRVYLSNKKDFLNIRYRYKEWFTVILRTLFSLALLQPKIAQHRERALDVGLLQVSHHCENSSVTRFNSFMNVMLDVTVKSLECRVNPGLSYFQRCRMAALLAVMRSLLTCLRRWEGEKRRWIDEKVRRPTNKFTGNFSTSHFLTFSSSHLLSFSSQSREKCSQPGWHVGTLKMSFYCRVHQFTPHSCLCYSYC